MSTSTVSPSHPFAPVLSWSQIEDALIHVTEPETKLQLIPAIMHELKRTASAGNPRAFTLTLAMQISLLSNPSYVLRLDEQGRADMS